MKFSEIYKELIDKKFFEHREFIERSLETIEKGIRERKSIIIRAPPGIGKTMITYISTLCLLRECSDDFYNVIHVIPTRSLIDDLYRRSIDLFNKIIDKECMKEVGRKIVTRQYGGVHEAHYLAGILVYTTYDTYFYNIMKMPLREIKKIYEGRSYGHYEIPRASVYSSLNIFDETHLILEESDEVRIADMFNTIFLHLSNIKVPHIIMTATMSTKILGKITNGLSRYGGVEFIDYSKYDYHKDSFYQREIEKTFEPLDANNVFINIQEYGIEKIIDLTGKILERVSNTSGGKIALITNTISRAKTFYRILRERFSRGDVILLTSRFTAKDKQDKLKKILGEEKILLISTQVIEVGVDASFDVIITELSPPSSLIQRMGRLARGEKKLGLWSIYYDQTTIEKGSGIYSPEMTRCSMRIIKDLIRDERKINWHLPETSEKQIVGYMNLLDPCWENINITPAYDTYVWEILEKPTITSEQVLRLNIYPRDENLCSLYIGNDIPSHLEELYEESLSRMIPVPCRTASEYINILRKRSYDIYVISYDPYREEILLQHVDDDILRKLYEIFDKPLKLITSNILGMTIPEEYYEGGLYGEGLKDVN